MVFVVCFLSFNKLRVYSHSNVGILFKLSLVNCHENSGWLPNVELCHSQVMLPTNEAEEETSSDAKILSRKVESESDQHSKRPKLTPRLAFRTTPSAKVCHTILERPASSPATLSLSPSSPLFLLPPFPYCPLKSASGEGHTIINFYSFCHSHRVCSLFNRSVVSLSPIEINRHCPALCEKGVRDISS